MVMFGIMTVAVVAFAVVAARYEPRNELRQISYEAKKHGNPPSGGKK